MLFGALVLLSVWAQLMLLSLPVCRVLTPQCDGKLNQLGYSPTVMGKRSSNQQCSNQQGESGKVLSPGVWAVTPSARAG